MIRQGVGDVCRHRHGPQGHQGSLGDRILGPVLRHDDHPIARPPRPPLADAARTMPPCRPNSPHVMLNARRRRGSTAASACPARPRQGEHHRRQVGPDRIISTSPPLGALRQAQPFDHGPLPYMEHNRSPMRTPRCAIPPRPMPPPASPSRDDLPAWDLSDLYPGPDSAALAGRLRQGRAGRQGVRGRASGQAGGPVGRRAGRGHRRVRADRRDPRPADVLCPVAVRRRFHRRR